MEIKLTYQPLRLIGGNVSENDFDLYISQPKWEAVAKKVAIEPLETAMKDQDRAEFNFGEFTVKRKMQKKTNTSWQGVYNSLNEFLNIRSVDGRQFEMDGLKFFDGLGYCILAGDLKGAVNGLMNANTSKSEYPQLYWPRMKKGEEVRQVVLPDVNYRKITPENARIVAEAKKFVSALEKGVAIAFKDANQKWFESETGYSKDNLPVKEDSPMRRLRMLARDKPVFVQLVREDVPQYQEVIDRLLTEIGDMEAGNAINGYKVKRDNGVYINIKTIQERLSMERLEKDDLIKSKGRYEIVP